MSLVRKNSMMTSLILMAYGFHFGFKTHQGFMSIDKKQKVLITQTALGQQTKPLQAWG